MSVASLISLLLMCGIACCSDRGLDVIGSSAVVSSSPQDAAADGGYEVRIVPHTGLRGKPDRRGRTLMLLQRGSPGWVIPIRRQPLPPKARAIQRTAVPWLKDCAPTILACPPGWG